MDSLLLCDECGSEWHERCVSFEDEPTRLQNYWRCPLCVVAKLKQFAMVTSEAEPQTWEQQMLARRLEKCRTPKMRNSKICFQHLIVSPTLFGHTPLTFKHHLPFKCRSPTLFGHAGWWGLVESLSGSITGMRKRRGGCIRGLR